MPATREMPVRVTLPSGAWVEVKDNFLPGDRFAVEGSVDVVIEDGKTYIHGAGPAQWKAFLTRAVTAWSYSEQGVPLPSQSADVLDSYPATEDDDDALRNALQERYERIVRRRPTVARNNSPMSETSPAS
jgi:hypothetical protein